MGSFLFETVRGDAAKFQQNMHNVCFNDRGHTLTVNPTAEKGGQAVPMQSDK